MERSPAERAAFLKTACGEDEELRREVESLLVAHEEADTFVARPSCELLKEVLAADEAARNPMIGQTLGHYEIKSLLGKGGMGEVYRAHDPHLDRQVAIKILPPQLTRDPEALPRFKREARAVAALSHPNILAIHDFGQEQGLHYAVMELLEGETLRARINRGILPWKEAARIAAAVAEGLSAAHAKGIIHRDLKPENIFLNADGQVKILDFGIARVKQQVTTANQTLTLPESTEPGKIIGTIGYMSPEQLRGEAADAPSDIFSLACVLFEMVYGERPFARESVTETMAAILRDEPPPLTGLRLNPEFERLLRRCLEKQPRARLQSAHDLALELRALASENQRLNFLTPAAPRRLFLISSAVLFVLLLAAAAYVFWPKKIDSLAVLPFANVGADPNAEYLSDGISESLINKLSQLPGIKVINRTSTFKYKGKEADPQEIARALGVRAILTGRIAARGDRLMISVELTDARDKTHVWGDQYLRDAADLLTVQAEISREIAEKLRLRLSGAQAQQIAQRESINPAAYDLLLKGRFQRYKGGVEDRRAAIEYFQQAIAADPNCAPAYAEMAITYRSLISSSILSPVEFTPRAYEAARRAAELNPNLAEAHQALALFKRDEWDWPGAEQEYKRALELNPNLVTAHSAFSSFLTVLGRHDEAIAEARRAHELDPLSPLASGNIGQRLYFARRYDDAIAALKRTLDLSPNNQTAYSYLGYTYTEKGQYQEAIAAYQRVIQLGGDSTGVQNYLGYAYARSGQRAQAEAILRQLQTTTKYVSPTELATLYAGLGDKEQAFAQLEKAYAARDLQLQFLGVDPSYDSLRSDPRFADLMRRVRLSS